ncbi:MAG: hypothetical protein WC600_05905 [Desulfobaccales bacterium]
MIESVPQPNAEIGSGHRFAAAATNLPELVVTLSALQIGAVDLAVGNLFRQQPDQSGILEIMGFYLC